MKDHDSEARWQSLVSYTHRLAREHCRPISAEDARDLAQDALVAFLSQERLRGPVLEPHAWLLAVLRHLDADRRRRRTRRREQALPSEECEIHSKNGPLGGWESLERMLDDLRPHVTPLERSIALALAAGETRGQIARETTEEVGHVYSAAKRILERVRKFVEQDEELSGDRW